MLSKCVVRLITTRKNRKALLKWNSNIISTHEIRYEGYDDESEAADVRGETDGSSA